MNEALKTAVASFVLAAAIAAPTYARACTPGQTGVTPDCPIYNEPVTAMPQNPEMGQSTTTTGTGRFGLFGGQTPPNGFMVSLSSLNYPGSFCWVDDNDAANINQGFLIGNPNGTIPGLSNTFITPPGYKPMNPVTMICDSPVSLVARAW